jgi:nucleoside-diphosphate-sugar epimerase
MKIMVTGATTPFGAALVDALLEDPRTDVVLAVGRERNAYRRSNDRLLYHALDLTRPRALHDLVWGEARDLEVGAVIHNMHKRAVHEQGHDVHAQNVDVTHELVVACTAHPTIRRFVYRSFAEVYATPQTTTTLIDEETPLDFDPSAPQWRRDRVAADLIALAHNTPSLEVAVLRCAEILAPGTGSQLWDYLQSRLCLRPLGFDPMINVLAIEDAVRALIAAVHARATGVFNIPGATTLPLSLAIEESSRADLPVPNALMGPLYGLRRKLAGFEFRYDMNIQRFHFGGVLDGTRARDELGFVPSAPVHWPRPWWRALLGRLGEQVRDGHV